MATPVRGGFADLGAQAVTVERMQVLLSAAVDVVDGGMDVGVCTHTIRVIDMATRTAYMVPCTAPFLRSVAAQANRAAGIPQPQNSESGGNDGS